MERAEVAAGQAIGGYMTLVRDTGSVVGLR